MRNRVANGVQYLALVKTFYFANPMAGGFSVQMTYVKMKFRLRDKALYMEHRTDNVFPFATLTRQGNETGGK
ncbi:hypothetical protein PG994_012596 [Apiospora phragmitis]|uniref:Uncharacterized protein n=1 Tax=Apiospora phragmitis TaxID=2905665 RepID=A0ABR1TDJ4_9PEZI